MENLTIYFVKLGTFRSINLRVQLISVEQRGIIRFLGKVSSDVDAIVVIAGTVLIAPPEVGGGGQRF